jgi:hypothetical protein
MATKWVEDGEPFVVGWDKDIRETCCGCGLVHRVKYDLDQDMRLVITAWREEESDE